MPEAAEQTTAQPNTTEARTETGAIKDQSPVTPTPAPSEAKPTDSKPSTATEAKPDVAAKADGEGEKPSLLNEKDKAAEGAPEKYEDFKAPEGFELNKEAIAEALPVFKELGLSQPEAQKLVDLYASQTQKAADAPMKLWQDTQQKWIEEAKADPEIGGKLGQVKETVKRAIDDLGDPKLANDFRAAMDYTGAGNNPAFIRAFYKLASKVTEGKNVVGNRPSPLGQSAPGAAPKSAAHTLFPNLP